jgi:LmbE family N-acetylglucosaminyl deacetylase
MSEAPIFYLSPHADDVAFSCAGSVISDVAAGREVTLITAFISGRRAEQRRAEDEKAAAILGCDYKFLELPDAPERPEIRGALDIFMPFGPRHLGITNEVMTRLLWHVKPPAEVRAPLAVGGHIDHRIVHEAARALVYQLGPAVTLSYYEDLPYCLLPYALGRRLDALEAQDHLLKKRPPGCERAASAVELGACRAALRGWPLAQRWLPGLRQLFCHLVASRMLAADGRGHRPGFAPRLTPMLRALPAEARARRQQAIAAYASQWPDFAASAVEFAERIDAYAGRLGAANVAHERLWLDEGVYGSRPAAQ